MKRHAILIALPKLQGHADLPGTLVDVAKVRRWLISNHGGPWKSEEIKTFTNPSYEELKPYLKYQSGCDYVFNLFAGHGYMVPGDYGADTVACLRDGVDLRVKMFCLSTLWHGYRANLVNGPPQEIVIPGRTPLPGAKPCPPPA